MRVSDLSYELPADRIAQHPPAERDGGRLLVLPRRGGPTTHARIRDLPSLLPARSLLVVNDVRVDPVRVFGNRPTGGRVEMLVLERRGDAEFDALASANKPLRVGDPVNLPGGDTVHVAAIGDAGKTTFAGRIEPAIAAAGQVPLPPYIRREPDEADHERYQTVYAREGGAVAAPTAGLHLSERLLSDLAAAGHGLARVWLAVGSGTFRPIRAESLDDHRMDEERYSVPAETREAVAAARREGRPIVAIGTTVVRTLESAADGEGIPRAGDGRTSLFVRPPFDFRAVDALLTNFHLPRSTLLALVCAFAGTERTLAAYREAVEHGYRFYSYGDAMLIG